MQNTLLLPICNFTWYTYFTASWNLVKKKRHYKSAGMWVLSDGSKDIVAVFITYFIIFFLSFFYSAHLPSNRNTHVRSSTHAHTFSPIHFYSFPFTRSQPIHCSRYSTFTFVPAVCFSSTILRIFVSWFIYSFVTPSFVLILSFVSIQTAFKTFKHSFALQTFLYYFWQ